MITSSVPSKQLSKLSNAQIKIKEIQKTNEQKEASKKALNQVAEKVSFSALVKPKFVVEKMLVNSEGKVINTAALESDSQFLSLSMLKSSLHIKISSPTIKCNLRHHQIKSVLLVWLKISKKQLIM